MSESQNGFPRAAPVIWLLRQARHRIRARLQSHAHGNAPASAVAAKISKFRNAHTREKSINSLWHHASQLANKQCGIDNEGDHPTAPSEIVISCGQIVSHQIDLVNFHVRERSRAAGYLDCADEVPGTFEHDYFTRRPDDLGKIDSCISRASAHIQHAFGNCKSGASPAI